MFSPEASFREKSALAMLILWLLGTAFYIGEGG